ncbi:MAG TPA: protein translocase subunit SecD [Ktedonobacteraceae bacterium]|nr:protein translocase subunit SecD [Ktedonobacteraceae bacterium]
MRRGTLTLLLLIIALAACAAYVDWPNNPGLNIGWLGINVKQFPVKEALDLQGGVRVLLIPDPSKKYNSDEVNNEIAAVRDNIEQRVNGGLGVSEPDIRIETTNNGPAIAVELPGLNSGDPFAQINSLLRTGDLEFWDTGSQSLAPNTPFDPSQFTQYNPGGKAQFTGKDLDPSQIGVGTDSQTGQPEINFEMKGDAIAKFGAFTQAHIGDYLTVTLDRKVISSPVIQNAITGPGVINGQFTVQEAQSIAEVLRVGALPLVLKVASEETVGPTLGLDSITKSAFAAAIGLGMVMLFMLLFYRLPGLLADIALLLYAGVTFAVFKVIGVTLSLAGIAGFILSIGMAVDANVLIFERVKEELRAGRLLASAIDMGWKRAWPSIRDSNISTLITCAVLFGFGSNFGASIIVGFATTLFLGVLISMFTAIVVTRTFLNLLVPTGVVNHPALFGLPAGSIATASLARRNSTV